MAVQLNEEQRRAVAHVQGRLLITAGAGSGKTRTLAERFAHAVDSRGPVGAGVDRILTITYTEKAAGELAERIRAALQVRGLQTEARAIDGAWISTIHALCARVLRREALAAGLDPAFTVANEVEVAVLEATAYEQVIHSLREKGAEDFERLLEAYGYAPLQRTVASLGRTLRARLIDPGDVDLGVVRTAHALIGDARALITETGACLGSYSGRASTPAEQHRACCELLESLDAIESSCAGEERTAVELWRALVEFGATMRTTKETREQIERLKEGRSALAAQCAAIIGRADASAVLRLVAEHGEAYRSLKRQRGTLDYDDLIIETGKLFDRYPEGLRRYREWFTLVMVDEFQDTDEVLLALIERLGEPNLATVGDVRQSIYAFRGADVAVYRRHRNEMGAAGARRVRLTENHRSHRDIIGFVNRTFSHESLFGPEDEGLRAARQETGLPRLAHGVPRVEIGVVDTSEGCAAAHAREVEASFIAERFAALREAGFAPNEMAILLRAYADALVFARALERAGIEAIVSGGSRFFSLREVGAMHALCGVIANPLDDEALARLLTSELICGGARVLARCAALPETIADSSSLWDRVAQVAALSEQVAGQAACVLQSIVNARERTPVIGLAAALVFACDELGIDAYLGRLGIQGRMIDANLEQFRRKAAAFEAGKGVGAAAFVASIDAERAVGMRLGAAACAGKAGAVTIMSIHAAKGLEFPVVAVPTLAKKAVRASRGVAHLEVRDGVATLGMRHPLELVSRKSTSLARSPLCAEIAERDAVAQREEAARLHYVACTRARDVLLLTGSGPIDAGIGEGDTPLAWTLGAHGAGLIAPLANAVPEQATVVDVDGIPVRVEKRSGAPGRTCSQEEGGRLNAEPPLTEGSTPTVEAYVLEPPRPVRPRRFSYSDLDVHRRCSLRYWAERVAGMGRAAARHSPGARAAGSAMHALLQHALIGGGPLEADRAAAIARDFGLDDREAQLLREKTEAFFRSRRGRDLLARRHGAKVESPFALVLGGDSGPLLVGVIDVYRLEDGVAELIDYKSGMGGIPGAQPEPGKAVPAHESRTLQAECYALAALKDGAERVTVRFVFPEAFEEDGEPREAVYGFESRDAARIERAVLTRWEAMGERAYCDIGTWRPDPCRGCPASGTVCRLTAPRRGAG